MSALSDDIALALADSFSVTDSTFTWNGQAFGCVINADQNTLVTSKSLFPANGIPQPGDKINLAGKDRQITAIANSVEEFVPGGINSADNVFVNDPANPSLAIQFSGFISK
jgi:hypothetical protein